MFTLIIAVTFAGGCFSAGYWAADFGLGWSITCGILGFGIFQGAFAWFIQKRVKGDMEGVQRILEGGQKRLQTKMQRWQMRPPGSIQAAQREILEDTKVFVKEALREVKVLAKYRGWVPMIDRQMATAELQLNWMIREFKEVDLRMDKALMMDPTMVAIRMARMYTLNEPTEAIGKVYAKAARRLKYNQNVLLAATWSWILVQRGDADGAFKALTEALKNSDNQTLKDNHERLMNNRVGHFSNSGIGDQWYSLYLEEPKVKMQRQRSVYR